jgi:hypothetical protein
VNTHSVRFFKLSPPGKGRGVTCDANGVFIDDVPLLKRVIANGKEKWASRDCEDISADLNKRYDLPIELSSKASGIAAIARALNEGSIVRAQISALFLRFPELPPLTKTAQSRNEWIRFIRQLADSGFIKARWDVRWPKSSPDSQGGRYAPGGSSPGGQPGIGDNGGPPLEDAAAEEEGLALAPIAALAAAALVVSTVPAGGGEDAAVETFEEQQLEQTHRHHPWPKYLGGPVEQALTKLPRWLHLKYHGELDADPKLIRRLGTDYFKNLNSADRAEVFRRLVEITKRFDAENGTHLYDDMIKNGFPVTP